jgi:hypothetical protein
MAGPVDLASPREPSPGAPVGYNSHRPHRPLNQRSPAALDTTPAHIGDVDLTRLRRTDHLGGLIHEYRMVA